MNTHNTDVAASLKESHAEKKIHKLSPHAICFYSTTGVERGDLFAGDILQPRESDLVCWQQRRNSQNVEFLGIQ